MSIQRTVSRFLTITFTLSLAGVAFARKPPALTAAQEQSARAIACEGATPRPAPGYRDTSIRTASRPEASPVRVAGYRDKFPAESNSVAVACVDAPRFSAQR